MKFRTLITKAAALILALSMTIPAAYAAEGSMSRFSKTNGYTPFTDVPSGVWYESAVKTAVELGLMKGKGGGLFDPMGGVTMAEVVTMAANIRSIYNGGGFVPGGTPWYQNAVEYAAGQGILNTGLYSDYTLPATREDMAFLFAYTLPYQEYARINRIAYIPDFSRDEVAAGDALFLLYHAGIFTGDATGAAHALDGLTRAEAATIACRLVLPGQRVRFDLTGPAPGTPVQSPLGDFNVSLPEGWTTATDEGPILSLHAPTRRAAVLIYRIDKADMEGCDLAAMAQYYYDDLPQSMPGFSFHENEKQAPRSVYFRGFYSMYYRFDGTRDGRWFGYQANCLENSKAFYLLYSVNSTGCTDAEWQQALDIDYSFDLEL